EFIENLDGLSDELRQHILRIHEQPFVPPAQRAYLLAALGSVKPLRRKPPAAFISEAHTGEQMHAETTAALADALALRIQAENAAQRLREQADAAAEARAAAEVELAAVRARLEQVEAERDALRHEELPRWQAQAEERERHAKELERSVEALRAQQTQLEDAVAQLIERSRTLEEQIGDQQRRIADREQDLAARQAEIAEVRSDLDAARRELEDARARVAELEANLQDARAAHQAAQQAVEQQSYRAWQAETQLAEIQSSMGWVAMQWLRRVRLLLAPDGSLRHRVLRKSFGGLRAAWRGARFVLLQAPLALLRRVPRPRPMSWYAYCFDRYKRARAAQAPGDWGDVHCPAQGGLVSIVLPVYNGADYVGESIESVLAQSYADFELIIVDDGSTDETPQIVDAYAARDERVRVIHQKNQKLPMALNNGFRAARGEWLTWTSADNRYKPEFLQMMIAELRRRPDWDCVYANQTIIDDDGRPLRGSNWYLHYQTPPGSEIVWLPRDVSELNIWPNNYVAAAFLYRARVPHLIGEYGRHRFGVEDYDYWMRVNAECTLRHASFDEPVYEYRIHADSLTSKSDEIGINPARDRLMVFEEGRRSFCLSSLVWCFDVQRGNAQGDRLVGALRRQVRDGGDVELTCERLKTGAHPRLWMPTAYVYFAETIDEKTRPPAAIPEWALKVLVFTGHQSLPTTVDSRWDVCVATFPAHKPVALESRPWQGWLKVADARGLMKLIDTRCKADHLSRIEDEMFEPPAPQCGASVIVCAYRRVDRLERAIVAAAEQLADATEDELIVVNNDPDDSAVPELVERLRQQLFAERSERLRLIDCPIPGLSHARNAGIAEARGEVLCFIDDDAIPCDGWLEALKRAFAEDPDAGVIGGRILLRVPDPAPEWLRPDWYGFWSHFDPPHRQYARVENWWEFPWGANWAARRKALVEICGFRAHFGRKGNDFGGGEELLAARLVQQLGYKVGVEPASSVTHDVEPERFTLHHVRQTIRAAVHVNYRMQIDLHLPMEASLKRTLWQAYDHFNQSTAFGLSSGERVRKRAYARAHAELAWRQIGDSFRRLRKPLVRR
ncbi:MAG: glycosyltransferase, partial [Planctomycetota bacterium]